MGRSDVVASPVKGGPGWRRGPGWGAGRRVVPESALFEDRLVEPSSGLGEALSYMLKHWDKLTLFYMSENGAHAGDSLMSLIYTCQLCDVNPFDYVTELLRHAHDLPAHPHHWMP